MLNVRLQDVAAEADREDAAGPLVPPAARQGHGHPVAVQLTPAQQAQLEALARGLTREQALWASGYLAAIGAAGSAEVAASEALSGAAVSASAVTLLYGSETGNSAGLAESFAGRLRAAGLDVRVSDMNSYKVRQLKDERWLLAITSTHGEGDPPQAALDFFEFIESRKAPKLPGLKFSVLALGDSTYEKYCEAGRRLDRRLEELGAERLSPRVDCDVDFEDPAAAWMEALQPLLPREQARPHAGAVLSVVSAPVAAQRFDKRNPFPATVLDNIVLTGRGSSKETRHIELSLADSGLVFEPGDALGILPRNDPAVVDAILSQTGLDGDAVLSSRGGETTLGQALASDFEIVTATPRFLEAWARLSDAQTLKTLVEGGDGAARNAFLHGHHVIDIIRAFPVSGVGAEDVIAGLRPLQPRLYSIASSLAAVPDEVHLTVSTVRYELHGEPRAGVASGQLAARVRPEDTLPVYVQSNPHFRLPADDAAVVMIGAGTGIAPYRSFLQEREERGASGRNWLVLGERNFRTDFLYQTEWQGWLAGGLLTRMDVAFSRDRGGKVYVQHRLREKGADLFAWLEEGAHIYVCGDAAHMAPDVHAALLEVLQQHGGFGPDAAQDYLRALQRDHRYQRDVY